MRLNAISAWLYIIGTRERASKLRKLLDKLPPGKVEVDAECFAECDGDPHCARDECEIYTPPMCPTRVLFGEREAAKLYADPETRKALDAWDTQHITKDDIRRYCTLIERGVYRGPAYVPMKRRDERRMAEAA